MKIVSWNVNGLRACMDNFFDYVADSDADFVAIQETRVTEPITDLDGLGYLITWNIAEKLGYSGTAVLHKHPPLSIRHGLGKKYINKDARVITLEYLDYYVITVYVPNFQTYTSKWYSRLDFDDAFLKYTDKLLRKKHLIICGDFNIAHKHIDIFPENSRNPEEQYGYLSEERDSFETLLSLGLVDVFRYVNPTERAYTWWSQMHPRCENKGRRLDYFLVSSNLLPKIKSCRIRSDILGSDHAPIELEIEL